MSFISPEARTTEQTVGVTISSPSASTAGMVGEFQSGPCYELITITSVQDLEDILGTPDDDNYKHYFTAWNFLQYANSLQVVRCVGQTSANAGMSFLQESAVDTTPVGVTISRMNKSDEQTIVFITDAKFQFYTKYPGTYGNSLKVAVCAYVDYDSIELTHGAVTDGPFVVGETVTGAVSGATGVIVEVDSGSSSITINNIYGTLGLEEYEGETSGATATVSDIGDKVEATTGVDFDSLYDFDLAEDEVLVVILDSDDTVLETFACSTTVGATDSSGSVIYLDDYLERSSSYVYGHNNTAQANDVATKSATALTGGTTVDPINNEIMEAWEQYLNPDNSDAWVLMLGGYNENSTIQKYVLQSIADERAETFVTVSPNQSSVVGVATESTTTTNLIFHRGSTLAVRTKYGAYFGNYKYQSDTYNSTYRWLPLDGDIAGLMIECAENVSVGRFAWGYRNGLIKNIIKLAWNPSKSARDSLWKKEINAVIMDNSSMLVFGNKTLSGVNDIFDVIDNRLLFNYIKRGLAPFIKLYISEKNNTSTQRSFYNSVRAFLQPLVGSRDIDEFAIEVGDEVNTDDVKASYTFRALVVIKPSASIRYVDLRLYGIASNVEIEEVISDNTA